MVGNQIGNWILENKIGEGGMGEIYLARHQKLDTHVAIKALAPELTRDPQFKERFFREAHTQAQLRHPGIAQVYDFIEQEGMYYIVVEYLEGGSIALKIAARKG